MMLRILPLFAVLALAAGSATADPADATQVEFLQHQSVVPADWVAEQPTSGMRVLQYQVPGEGDSEPGNFIVYYFGPGQGGSVEANLERWRSQFSGPDGGPVTPAITQLQSGGAPATLVELEGSYARSVGVGQEGELLPQRMLLAAVVETAQGNLYPQLHGPADLVRGQREAFVAFVTSIEPDAGAADQPETK